MSLYPGYFVISREQPELIFPIVPELSVFSPEISMSQEIALSPANPNDGYPRRVEVLYMTLGEGVIS